MNKSSTLILTLQRYNPERDSAPHDELFPVPWDEQTSLLDALGYIKDNLAHDLAALVVSHGDLRLLRRDG